MSYCTIFYLEPSNEGLGASLSTEKTFSNTKSMSQFVRRNKIKNHSVYLNGQLCVLIGNKYLPVHSLQMLCSYALFDAQNNAL